MPVNATTTTVIPGTSDKIAWAMSIVPRFTQGGVTAAASFSAQHYRCNDDGSNPVKVGDARIVSIPDVFAKAATDAAFAAWVTDMQNLAQSFVTANGL